MNENKEIRFINPQGKEQFRIPDGGSIAMTYPDGEQDILVCKHLDDTHFEAGGRCYHTHRFAEIQGRNGAKVEPEVAPEIVQGYRVLRRIPVGEKVFVLAHNPNAVQPFVTWLGHRSVPGYCWGHYWSSRAIADLDLSRRAAAERTGRSYDHTKLTLHTQDRER